MGVLFYYDRGQNNGSGFMAFPLSETELIVVSSVLGVIAFLFTLAIGTYCYRRQELYNRKLQSTKEKDIFLKRTLYRSEKNPSPKRIAEKQVRNGHVNAIPSVSSKVRTATEGPPLYNSYPGGVRIVRVPQRASHHGHPRQMTMYRVAQRPIYTQPHQPSTVPHLRLSDYRPKVLGEYVSPHTIRNFMNESFSHPNSSLSSINSDGTRHVWYPAKPDKVNFMQLDEKGTQTKAGKAGTKMRNSATSTSEIHLVNPALKTIKRNSNVTLKTQVIESGSNFVIIDYLGDIEEKDDSPLSTSTPRDNNNTASRQRMPHQGSIDQIPNF